MVCIGIILKNTHDWLRTAFPSRRAEGPDGGDAEEGGDGQDAVGDAPPDHLIPPLGPAG